MAVGDEAELVEPIRDAAGRQRNRGEKLTILREAKEGWQGRMFFVRYLSDGSTGFVFAKEIGLE